MQDILTKIERELVIRNYSSKTQKAYQRYIEKYLEFVSKKKYVSKNEAIKDFLFEHTSLS